MTGLICEPSIIEPSIIKPAYFGPAYFGPAYFGFGVHFSRHSQEKNLSILGKPIYSSRERETIMPSFDIVSEVDLSEVDNAVQNVMREITVRYDFKGSQSKLTHQDGVVNIFADDDLKLKQLHEILRGNLHKRGIEPGQLDYQKIEPAAGQSIRQNILMKAGIDKELAKKIVKDIKGSKIKVQVAIQGDELRVTGKKRDDLQAAIQFVKELGYEQPFQFKNFRD